MTSKVFILGALLCTATLGSLHAQAKDLQFGLKGGLGSSDISGSSGAKTARVGLQVGGVLTQKISDNFSMQYEAIYSQKGIAQTAAFSGVEMKAETNIDYLEIPVLAKYKVMDKVSIYGGGYAGLALSKKLKITVSSVSGEADLGNQANDLDYGLILGGQMRITDKIIVDARYNLGLTKVLKSGDNKNSTISIAATYLL